MTSICKLSHVLGTGAIALKLAGAVFLFAGSAVAQDSMVTRNAAGPLRIAPPENFTGDVVVSAPYEVGGDSRLRGSSVTFSPGARTNWHRHPLGQVLVVMDGCGWTQAEGGPIEKICEGDVAWVGPDVMHWHGAMPTVSMTHVTASESVEGEAVEWLEAVGDAIYNLGPD